MTFYSPEFDRYIHVNRKNKIRRLSLKVCRITGKITINAPLYLHNLDLWGMVTSTISVCDLLVANMKILNSIEKNVLDIVDDLFHHILECDNNKISGQKIIDSFQKIAELYNVRQPEPLRTTDSTKTTTHTASSRRKLTSRKVSSKTLRQSLTTYKSITYKDKTFY